MEKRSKSSPARKIVLALTIIAHLICSVFLNGMGGMGLFLNNYEDAGAGLFVSVLFLTMGIIFTGKGRMVIPAIFDIIGTGGYIYTIRILDAIPHTKIPKESVEPLIMRIYPAVIVSVLLLVLIIMNYFSDEQEEKRDKRRRKKWEAEQRPLNKDEHII